MVSNTHTCTVIQARDTAARAAAEAVESLGDALQSLTGRDDSIAMGAAERLLGEALSFVAKAQAFAAAATVRAKDAEDAIDLELGITHNGRRTDAAATKPGGGTPPATLPLVSLGQGEYRRDIRAEDVVDPRGVTP